MRVIQLEPVFFFCRTYFLTAHLVSCNNNGYCAQCRRVFLPVKGGEEVFYLCEIRYIKADGNDVVLYFKNRNETRSVSIEMRELEELFIASGFDDQMIRCHISNIVNRNFIKKYVKGKAAHVEMIPSDTVSIGGMYLSYFKDRLHGVASLSPTFKVAVSKVQPLTENARATEESMQEKNVNGSA